MKNWFKLFKSDYFENQPVKVFEKLDTDMNEEELRLALRAVYREYRQLRKDAEAERDAGNYVGCLGEQLSDRHSMFYR
ncbi:hypothetical protein IQ22_03310 [Pseudomonas duriflava]|uniref:Uncharacterized protein n=1 Tax=Pseudomonas duriflava TaxID=459528 RepID=A0A562Q8M7_9PSED|nr:hypothetical protein [Pseudomonas duriflava]TWI52540.1 hypothetical protein IQ22_03310 [Pseudomonas duriflava]